MELNQLIFTIVKYFSREHLAINFIWCCMKLGFHDDDVHLNEWLLLFYFFSKPHFQFLFNLI